jgi:hypothetical protein
MVFVVLLAALPAFGDAVRHSFESSVPRGQVRRVVIDVPAGDIDVRNGPRDRIAVSGWVTRDPDSERNRPKEQRIANDSSVEIQVSSDDEAVVRRRFGPQAEGWRAGIFTQYHVKIEVPVGTSVDVQTRFGDLSVEGSFGDIDIDLRAGDVDVRIPKKDVRQLNASARVGEVRTKLGDETVERGGVFPGTTRYNNPSGRSIVNVHVTAGDLNVDLTR